MPKFKVTKWESQSFETVIDAPDEDTARERAYEMSNDSWVLMDDRIDEVDVERAE